MFHLLCKKILTTNVSQHIGYSAFLVLWKILVIHCVLDRNKVIEIGIETYAILTFCNPWFKDAFDLDIVVPVMFLSRRNFHPMHEWSSFFL